MRALIAYFSRADENYFSGELRTIPVGNTEVAAKLLQRLTGADLFQLEPLLPYSKDYNECIAQKQDFLLLTGGDLPEPAAWPALCQELTRNGLISSMAEDGIQIQIKREDRRKE